MKTSRALSALAIACLLALPAVLAAPQASPAAEPVVHRVTEGDNLHLLAAYYYRDPRRWDSIWKANNGLRRRNASLLPVGIDLTIPAGELRLYPLPYAEWRALVEK